MLTLNARIELARSADAVDMGALSRTEIEHGLGWKYTPSHLRALMRSDSKNLVAARSNGLMLGFGLMSYADATANLDLLAVRRPWRNRGVGRQIVEWLEAVAGTAGVASVFVQVRAANTGALRFYEALDYREIERVRGYYLGRESAVVLCRSLTPLPGA